jgi:hypothetical protein
MDIVDVSPNRSNTNASDIGHSVTGRMLSIACTSDGQELYAGSYANVWVSSDGGQNWEQHTWPQPDPSQFDVPGALGGWCVVDIAAALGWRVARHPRFLASLRTKGVLDIVGFGECGMWTALGNGDGTFQNARVVNSDFSPQPGGWEVDKHPRFMADLQGNGLADVVGFAYDGVWTAMGKGDGTFHDAHFVLADLGYDQGWRVDKHPRFVQDINGDGKADVIGFGEDYVWTAIGDGQGGFPGGANSVHDNFAYNQGWRVHLHPRFVADLDKDRLADIIGFFNDGVWVAFQNLDGSFSETDVEPVIPNFGVQQGWRVDRHPRYVVDLDGDGYPDILGFGNNGVWAAINDKNRGFKTPVFTPGLFGYNQGWRVDKHPRLIIDLNGDGIADLIGFGDAGIYTAIGRGDGTFEAAQFIQPPSFGVDQGWRVDRHPRLAEDLGNGNIGIVAFGDAGVWTALGDGQGGFPAPNFVLPNFGYGTIVLALVANDLAALAVHGPFKGDRGLWRSTDWGLNWTQVHQFSTDVNVGQVEWALGSDHLVYVAGGASLAISQDAGTTFGDVFPFGQGGASVNHIAVWQNSPGDKFPAVIYALGVSAMAVSIDGGASWMQDPSPLPSNIGAATSQDGNSNAAKVMAISPRFPLQVYVAQDASPPSGQPALYLGDYTQFIGTQQSSWQPMSLPDALMNAPQDSGNVFLAATQRGRGDLLFYGPQRLTDQTGCCSAVWVGPFDPDRHSDWHRLGPGHADLHGVLLSPDFKATLTNGSYHWAAGRIWMLSDGGLYRSADGGEHFAPADSAATLASLSVAGVAIAGKGVALSLNQGDNDGFYSMNGGQNWSYQQYGGGDNDCAFADPLRPHAIMVFTPRWDSAGNSVGSLNEHACQGQTVSVYQTQPGNLPNASLGGHDRKAVTGPPIDPTCGVVDPPREIWNASTPYVISGFRPFVLGLTGEAAPDQGDYIFVLGPNDPNPVLVRTQNIFDIKHRNEWVTTATGPGQGAKVYQQGPPLPEPGLGAVQAAGGHANTVFYAGGNGHLWKWTTGDTTGWQQIVGAPSASAKNALIFFVHPYRPNVIYILDREFRFGFPITHIKRSDDGGSTWNVDRNLEKQLTWNGRIPTSAGILTGNTFTSAGVLFDMKFDPVLTQAGIALGAGGAFLTIDGVNWTRLLHTAALGSQPANCYLDTFSGSSPAGADLYVAFSGRSLVKITNLLLTQIV